jgi:DNA-binding transcriptional LysR family regulator
MPRTPPPASRLDWDDLRYALAIAEEGSLAGAARALEVRHSTVLRRLDALERRLGARLFDRRRQGYTPTEAGELMAQQARAMRPAIAEMQRRILGRDLQLTGSVRLNTSYIAMLYLLPLPLAAFASAHPGIEVEVVEAMALVDLSRRDADVALRISAQVPQHLVGRQLGTVRFRVYARRGAKGLPQRRQPVEQLVETAPWIGFEGDRSGTFFERWMNTHVSAERIRLRVDLFHSMNVMLKTGLGVGLLPTFVGSAEPELVAVSDDIERLSTPIWMLTHPDLRGTARIGSFMQEVGEAIALRLSGV